MAKNLLMNPNGAEQLSFWDVIKAGGNKWKVEDMPGPSGHEIKLDGVRTYFATSYQLCLKRQVIDLLAQGYSAEELDAQPVVAVEDWYSGRTDCGCVYQITITLLDENQEVIQRFKPCVVTLQENENPWTQVIHTFSNYGCGLRFISFEHGGHDTKSWEGWYGVRVTGSSVKLYFPMKPE